MITQTKAGALTGGNKISLKFFESDNMKRNEKKRTADTQNTVSEWPLYMFLERN